MLERNRNGTSSFTINPRIPFLSFNAEYKNLRRELPVNLYAVYLDFIQGKSSRNSRLTFLIVRRAEIPFWKQTFQTFHW